MTDLIIRRATILDGTGADRFIGDVAVTGDRITAVGDLSRMTALREIDGAGSAVAPGFIDTHTHDDTALLVEPDMPYKVSQGVTTVVTGNCGVSVAPILRDDPPAPINFLAKNGVRFGRFSDYVAALEAAPPAVNAALMIGHSSLRAAVMSDIERPANDAEIEAMRDHVREALDCGAIGFSTGLFYPPAIAAPSDEVVAVLEPLRGSGAVYTTHMRDEADGVEESLSESFETARRAGVPLVISHHKCMGKRNFGRSTATLAKIDEAKKHQQVSLDAYPYIAGSTSLLDKMIDQANRILVTGSQPHPELAGRDLSKIAADWGVTMKEAMARLRPGGAIYFMMDEADVDRILSYSDTMIGSDGIPLDAFPHPRLWGTFPRVLGHYVRERRLFSLEEAVRRMTSLPAERFGFVDRGVIRPGAVADLVMFDPDTIADAATFEAPTQAAKGIKAVLVNGVAVLQDGRSTGARPGKVIRRASAH